MLFHSLEFMLFFLAAALGYFILPKKCKKIWLLGSSYYFYMCWDVKNILFLIFTTVQTWAGGLLLGKLKAGGKEVMRGTAGKLAVAVCAIINLGILAYFKYFHFILYNLNIIFSKIGVREIESTAQLLLPIGMSFYTFQAIGYVVDVYREEVEPEGNILNYAVFLSFFPYLPAGPIGRAKNLLAQIRRVGTVGFFGLFDYERIARGMVLMLWGYFQKLVIADRIAVFVDAVYSSWESYGTVVLMAATAAFSIQIYCDFASYSLIAAGAAKVMGFELMENFSTPYFSRSMKEFWRRWHISLSTWFRDYLYIPLGGGRCGRLRKYFNLMATFIASGLWHGASWNYVAWGAVHGILQIAQDAAGSVFRRGRRAGMQMSFSYKLGQVAVTYALTVFSLVFFRSASLRGAVGFLGRVFTKPDPWALTDGTFGALGLGGTKLGVLLMALGILFLVSVVRYKKQEALDVFLAGQYTWFRWLVIVTLFSFIFLFGVYGPEYDESQFIYLKF